MISIEGRGRGSQLSRLAGKIVKRGAPARRQCVLSCLIAIVKGARSVHVECVAEYHGVEMPRRLHLGRRKVEIVESYFKVKGDDGNVYILRFDEPAGNGT